MPTVFLFFAVSLFALSPCLAGFCLFCLSFSRLLCCSCLSVSLSLSVFFLSLFSLSLCFLCLCVLPSWLLLWQLLSASLLSVSTSPFLLFLLCLSFLCPSVFLFAVSFGVLSLDFLPSALWFLCLSVSSVPVCCLLTFC